MTTVAATNPSITGIPSREEGILIRWTPLVDANRDGDAQYVGSAKTSITVLAAGTWGGSTLTMQGSMDGTNFYDLNKSDGTPAELTADGFLSLSDLTPFLRPLSSDGSTVSISVWAFVR